VSHYSVNLRRRTVDLTDATQVRVAHLHTVSRLSSLSIVVIVVIIVIIKKTIMSVKDAMIAAS